MLTGRGILVAIAISPSHEPSAYGDIIELLIKATKGRWHPKTFMSDFELAITEGIKHHFSDIHNTHCVFHLMQSVRRWLQNILFCFYFFKIFI